MSAEKRILAAVLMALSTATGHVSAQQVGPLPGDGIGEIQSYDFGRKVAVIGRKEVPVTPIAAARLEQQLREQGRVANRPFAARFTIVQHVNGVPVIDSIYVFPPTQR